MSKIASVYDKNSKSVILDMRHPNKDVPRPEIVIDTETEKYAVPGGKTFELLRDARVVATEMFSKAGFVCQ